MNVDGVRVSPSSGRIYLSVSPATLGDCLGSSTNNAIRYYLICCSQQDKIERCVASMVPCGDNQEKAADQSSGSEGWRSGPGIAAPFVLCYRALGPPERWRVGSVVIGA